MEEKEISKLIATKFTEEPEKSIENFFTLKLQPIFKLVVPRLWVPLTIAFASLLLFGFVDQTREIYRSFALDKDIPKIILSTLSVLVLSYFVRWWYLCSLSCCHYIIEIE